MTVAPATIRRLDPQADLAAVAAMLDAATDYYRLWLGRAPTADDASKVFTDGPPYEQPGTSRQFGLFVGDALSGVAALSFGFPAPQDAYLGLMILSLHSRGQGHGRRLLAHVEAAARAAGAPALYLGVLQANPRGRAFWQREGFGPTGVSRVDDSHGLNHTIYRLVKPL